MDQYNPTPREQEALELIKNEKNNWFEGQVWFTDRESFLMRNIVKKCRKNFYGVFDEPKDPVTGRQKIFVPLTEWVIETIIKNIDIDTKDVKVSPKKKESSLAASVFQKILQNRLDNIRFGIILNDNNRNICTDGTGILKAWKENGKLCVKTIDRLNMLWDPSSIIDESAGVIEMNTLSVPELQEYANEWQNIEYVKGDKSMDRSNLFASERGTMPTEIPYTRVYERYGWASKFILTGEEEDRDKYVYLLIVATDIDESGVIHKIKEVKWHPYQDFQFKKLLNRGDGRGPAEMLFNIQAYVNETVNTRLNTARIVQMGLWRVGGNVTPQQLKKMFSTYAIKAEQGQIERLNTGTIDPSSYKDEEVAYQWAQRVTQSQREDEMAASKPATNALIEEKGANKAYGQIIEGIMLNLSKFLEEKIVPIIISTIKEGDIEKITGDPEDLRRLRRPFIVNLVRSQNEQRANATGTPLFMTQEEEDMEVARLEAEMDKEGNTIWFPIFKKAFDTEFEIQIDPSEDSINKGIMVQQLNSVLGTLTNAGVPITDLKDVLQEIYDTMGLPGEKLVEKIGATPMVNTAIDQAAVPEANMPMPGNMTPTN
jgi:hypothetical protein